MDMPRHRRADKQWGDRFEIETLMNVRVAAGGHIVREASS